MPVAFLALGANLGDRLAALSSALRTLVAQPAVRVDPRADVASVFETSPVGGPPDQPPYLNSALRLRTSLDPLALLRSLLSIETRLGRIRTANGAPRTLDLDLLLYDDRVVDSPELTLPHPRLHERLFVLEPLAEIAPDLVHPVLKAPIRELLDRLRRQETDQTVVRLAGPEWADLKTKNEALDFSKPMG